MTSCSIYCSLESGSFQVRSSLWRDWPTRLALPRRCPLPGLRGEHVNGTRSKVTFLHLATCTIWATRPARPPARPLRWSHDTPNHTSNLRLLCLVPRPHRGRGWVGAKHGLWTLDWTHGLDCGLRFGPTFGLSR